MRPGLPCYARLSDLQAQQPPQSCHGAAPALLHVGPHAALPSCRLNLVTLTLAPPPHCPRTHMLCPKYTHASTPCRYPQNPPRTMQPTSVACIHRGNPAEPEFYSYMKSYSPVDNVQAAAYPHILVTAGLHDPRVGYW